MAARTFTLSPEESARERPPPGNRPYRLLLWSTAAWFLAHGMHNVLVTWLLVGELQLAASWVGTVQMLQTLPVLGLILLGGAVADRVVRRRFVSGLHVAAAAVAVGMGWLVAAGALSLALAVGYALCWGTLQAFNHPARDSLVSEVAPRRLMSAITGMTLVQFGAIAGGSMLAGLTEPLGTPPSFALMAALVLAGVVALAPMPTGRAPDPQCSARGLHAVRSGLSVVWHSPILRPAALFVAANGLLFLGPYMVLCPIVVRDVYAGGRDHLSMLMAALTLGTMAGSSLILWRGPPERPLLVFRRALLGVASCLVAIALEPPFPVFVALIFVWGWCHAFFFNTSRTLFQEQAPPDHLSRVVSIHALGAFGMAPLSNLGAGFLGDRLGAAAACAASGAAMWLLVIVFGGWFRCDAEVGRTHAPLHGADQFGQ
jgi:MFS family permease